ncbi:translocating chain-associated membrane protein 1-like 1 isoform X2 [Neopsephotus bourkii]|uniref:translocating chain-associated membrane protein 1-like 1 isoform X2 n=1 Tax=Neopsephotus bourkii TaxID=309878 RepID=UPI002AA5CB10|nr:translocating chain-associated membrane protein 1-like 1 isoform X2 [Neopsephotus bourkii]
MRFRRKYRTPAVINHEVIVQNLVDFAYCLAVFIVMWFIFEVPPKVAIMFVALQYNVTYTIDDNTEQFDFYDYGPKDIATIGFYMLVAIKVHAVIQECILDKINRHLQLSEREKSKFNESGQLALFYLFSFIWGASILNAEEFSMNLTSFWKDYPFSRMLFQEKFFYVCQIAYWIHALPELYFQKVQKEDIPRQLCYICLYITHISGAYILNLQHLGLILVVPHYLVEFIFHALRLFYFPDENMQKGFIIWALLFIMVRLLTLTLSVLTFGFGLARAENPGFSIADGNFNTLPVRIGCLGAVCLTQAWMMRKFVHFQLKKWRERVKDQIPEKKTTNPKKKRTKKEPGKANFANGAAKPEDGASPRTRKSKPV